MAGRRADQEFIRQRELTLTLTGTALERIDPASRLDSTIELALDAGELILRVWMWKRWSLSTGQRFR